ESRRVRPQDDQGGRNGWRDPRLLGQRRHRRTGAAAVKVGDPDYAAPEDAPAEETSPRDLLRRFLQGDLASLRVILAIALIWIIFALQNERFLSAANLTNLFLQITAVGLIAVGVVMVLLLGEIDLSVGAVSGFAAAVMAVLRGEAGGPPGPGIA